MDDPITVKLAGRTYADARLKWSAYAALPHAPALRLDSDEGPLATATVYLTHQEPAAGCILVKDWSENEGMFDSLVAADIILPTGRVFPVNEWGSNAREGIVLSPYIEEMERVLESLPL